jgi:hypothetical protein
MHTVVSGILKRREFRFRTFSTANLKLAKSRTVPLPLSISAPKLQQLSPITPYPQIFDSARDPPAY